MIRVIYRWQVRGDLHDEFRAWWHDGTVQIRNSHSGALGSTLLHSHDVPGQLVGVARWASLDALMAFREMVGSLRFPGAELVSMEILDELDDLTTASVTPLGDERGAQTRREPSAYESIGRDYATRRQPDPRFEALIHSAAGPGLVLNVGAGTGSYEPAGRTIAVEPSMTMIDQRPDGAAPVVQAVSEALPFADSTFDVAMAVLTVHHWTSPETGLAELRRVAQRRVVFCFDPTVHNAWWLMDYFPDFATLESARALPIDDIVKAIDGHTVTVVPVPHDCLDGMTVAYWRRPDAYLDPAVRKGSSRLQQIPPEALHRGLAQLEKDLRTGAWEDKYGTLLHKTELDCGLRIIAGGT